MRCTIQILSVFLVGIIPVFGQLENNNFVAIRAVVPSIIVEARYFTTHNFVGAKIKGYYSNKCILTKEAAKALNLVQKELLKKSMSLKVYDCYRPQQSVNHFIIWAKNLKDTITKPEFYAHVGKETLFEDGYISDKSGHSRGSTLDLTIIKLPVAEQEIFDVNNQRDCILPYETRFRDNSIDMGTGYDCFHPLSHTANANISEMGKKNRKLLLDVMIRYGFKNYAKEWWHFTLKNEPYTDTYFDFPVK